MKLKKQWLAFALCFLMILSSAFYAFAEAGGFVSTGEVEVVSENEAIMSTEATEPVVEATDPIVGTVEESVDEIEEAVDEVEDKADEAVDGVEDKADEAGEAVDGAEDKVDGAGEAVDGAEDKVDGAGEAVDGAEDKVDEIGEATGDATGEEEDAFGDGSEKEEIVSGAEENPDDLESDIEGIPVEVCEECGQVEGHLETCSKYLLEDAIEFEDDRLAIGDEAWLMREAWVYQTQSTDEAGWQLWRNYKVEILNVITINETEEEETDAEAAWYEIRFLDLNLGESMLENYRYVQAEEICLEEPEDAGNICDCGENAPKNLAKHEDCCPWKLYILSLVKERTAEEIYAGWDAYDEQTQKVFLQIVKVYYAEIYDALFELASMNWTTAQKIFYWFDELEEEYEEITSSDNCEAFYNKMMSIYGNAFDVNEQLIIEVEELKELDERVLALKNRLYNDFGYAELSRLTAAYRTSNLTSGGGSADGAIVTDKSVSIDESTNGYLLTLESYVTGKTVDYVQPVDLILALDQSASMYMPMGMSGGKDNASLFTESSEQILRYALDAGDSSVVTGCMDLKAMVNNSAFLEKASQLGYLVAQSRVGGKYYQSTETYDWFVVQYVDGKWNFYRINRTARPSRDIKGDYTYKGNNPITYNSLDEIGDSLYYFYKSQTGALYDAITSFAKDLHDSGADHRLAVVGYSSGNYKTSGDRSYNIEVENDKYGSGIYIDGEYHPYNTKEYNAWEQDPATLYSNATLTAEEYKSALMSVQDDYPGILSSLKNVKTDYYQTYQNIGLDMALNIVKKAGEVDTDKYGRKQIVVLFTDGSPSGPKEADIVAKAAEIKAEGAEIYTICTSSLSENERDFLAYTSSNYPDARVENNSIVPGDKASSNYEKTAASADDLVNQFNSIVQDANAAYTELKEDAILQDAISKYFALPVELTEALEKVKGESTSINDIIKKYIQVYTAKYNGNSFEEKESYEAAKVTIEKDSERRYSIIKVTGFDYSGNFVSSIGRGDNASYYGEKLIVEIKIVAAEDNLGGIKLPTNVPDNSGIYVEDKRLKDFPLPYVDVPTTITVQKVVEGSKADASKTFTFHVSELQVEDYQYDAVEETYLKANGRNSTGDFRLSASDKPKTIENVLVGTTFTIQETEDEKYTSAIKVYDATGAEVYPTLCADGSYSIEVVPGMKIVYTNTYKLADLTICKSGIEDVDNHEENGNQKKETQNSIFKVTDGNGFELEITIVGNDSVTIKDLPVGTYTVEEVTSWSWRYEPTESSQTITLNAAGENKVTFTNSREETYWLSGDSYCKNQW